jgi:hypothetical protein
MSAPFWNPEKKPANPGAVHVCRQISPGVPCECLAADSLENFCLWLEAELELLLESNRDWETSHSNRDYFGRHSI